MKIGKFILASAASIALAGNALAGGILTNTNQSVAFLRHITRGVTLDADAPYYNPAGTAFMDNGWMLSLNAQSAFMTRTTSMDYAPFAMSAMTPGNSSQTFKGKIWSPVVPNIHVTYKHDRWALFLSAGVSGGGGRVKFNEGLGSFEQQFAVLPAAISALGQAYGMSASQYSLACSFRGLTMNLSGQIGFAYRLTDWLSASAMVRLNYTRNKYDGHINDIMVNPSAPALGFDGSMIRADNFLTAISGLLQAQNQPQLAGMAAAYAELTHDKYVDCIQKGWGMNPSLALYFQKGSWSASARYEFRTAMTLKNHTERDDLGAAAGNAYADGGKTPNDIPAMLSLALGKSFADGRLRLTAEYHYFFDEDAHMVDNKQTLIDAGTAEYMFGAEYDLSKKFLVSAGVQRTVYSTSDAYFTDTNHVLSATSIGLGGAWNISPKVRLNAGYFITLYDKRSVANKVSTLVGNIDCTTLYKRRSGVLGVGVDLKFGRK